MQLIEDRCRLTSPKMDLVLGLTPKLSKIYSFELPQGGAIPIEQSRAGIIILTCLYTTMLFINIKRDTS